MSKPDILERLMDYGRCHDGDVDEAAEEIKKLRCEVAVLHRRVHVAQSLRLTDAEREALQDAADILEDMEDDDGNSLKPEADTLRGLRERLKGGGA